MSLMGRECQFTGYESRRWAIFLRGLALRLRLKGRFLYQSGRRSGEALNDWHTEWAP